MPVISKFLDASGVEWNIDGDAICYGEAGYLSISFGEIPEFIEWLQAEYDKRQKPEPKEDDGWIKWEGGECPVSPKQGVVVRFRNLETEYEGSADRLLWDHDGSESDIIEYRIVK